MDDELLHEFIAETREHLATIEADLLTIEENGDKVDQELINKVFRAAHSIKGGSGFFGLEKIKELSHRAETVLDMMRAGKMAPNPEITNLLLLAFDQLREMSNDPAGSEELDISDLLVALNDLASSYLDLQGKASLNQTAVLSGAVTSASVNLQQTDVERAVRTGQSIYRVQYDLIQDIEARNIHLIKLFNSLCAQGEILDCAVDFAAVGSLDDDIGNHLPLMMVYATTAAPPQAAEIMQLSVERLEILEQPQISPVDMPPALPLPLPLPLLVQPVAAPISDLPLVESVVAATVSLVSEVAAPLEKKNDNVAKKKMPVAEETLRVNVSLLENLMNLAGELVLGRNQLRAAIAQDNALTLSLASQHLNQVTSELQDAIMQTRLQPIGNVFGKFPRVVRDMCNSLAKEINVDIQGKEVELDRSLLEGLSDPLTHMIRNAADHGLETPAERSAAGKSVEGTLTISARHEAGHVVIQIVDDGRGIDPEKIAALALKKGQVSSEKLAGMSAQEKLELIMMPGFSTAEMVSEFSGRGVGMDVVRTNINKLGGQVDISSTVGAGTSFRIKLPLTLAIIPSLIISLEKERFAIPQSNVAELLRIRAEDVKRRIEIVGGAEVLLLRDTTLPLVRFERFLGLVPTYVDPDSGQVEVDRRTSLADRRSLHHPDIHAITSVKSSTAVGDRSDGRRHRTESALEIAVINSGAIRYGLVVGGFHDTEEIVVKPLGRHVKHLTEYAGATILGDGAVALIIDAAGLAEKAELASVSASARALELKAEAERRRLEDVHSLLMFFNAPGELCAVFLEQIDRIERISRDRIETHGGRRTMQYRGASLPLVTLSDTAKVEPLTDEQNLVVLVARVGEREVGLLGALPVDVIESNAVIDVETHLQPGITGSAVIGTDTVLLVDIHEMVEAVWPDWSRPRSGLSHKSATGQFAVSTPVSGTVLDLPAPAAGPAILLAEDSDFFRAQVKKYIEDSGYRVYAGVDGEAAWGLLVAHLNEIELVVTDIEMPRLNGLQLTQRIRADQRTAHLPVIAVSSLAGEDDRARGAAAGVTEYQIKLDREALREGIARLLK